MRELHGHGTSHASHSSWITQFLSMRSPASKTRRRQACLLPAYGWRRFGGAFAFLSDIGLPSQLKQNSIEKSTRSPVHNWMLIQYVLHFPPAVFIRGKRIELTSKKITRTVAENLFASFMANVKLAKRRKFLEKAPGCDKESESAQHRETQSPHPTVPGKVESAEMSGGGAPVLPVSQALLHGGPVQCTSQPAESSNQALIEGTGGKAQAGIPQGLESADIPADRVSSQQQSGVPELRVPSRNVVEPRTDNDAVATPVSRSNAAVIKRLLLS